MSVVLVKCFCKVKFWFSGRLFDDVINSLHAEIVAKAPRPRIPLDSCGLDNTLILYALDINLWYIHFAESALIFIYLLLSLTLLPRPVQVSEKNPVTSDATLKTLALWASSSANGSLMRVRLFTLPLPKKLCVCVWSNRHWWKMGSSLILMLYLLLGRVDSLGTIFRW